MVCKAHMIPDKVTGKKNKNLTTACVCKCKNMLEMQIQKVLYMAGGKAYSQNEVVTARDDLLLYEVLDKEAMKQGHSCQGNFPRYEVLVKKALCHNTSHVH